MTGIQRIEQERHRQVFELGLDSGHDDAHRNYELACAAECYRDAALTQINGEEVVRGVVPMGWPWEPEAWKPANNPVRNLEKAGALFLAERMRVWRKGDKVLAQSYTGRVAECAGQIDQLLNNPISFHQAELDHYDKIFKCIVTDLPGERRLIVGVAEDGDHVFKISRIDNEGKPTVLVFGLTPDAYKALEHAMHQLRLNQK